jgi:hypothetical protein
MGFLEELMLPFVSFRSLPCVVVHVGPPAIDESVCWSMFR